MCDLPYVIATCRNGTIDVYPDSLKLTCAVTPPPTQADPVAALRRHGAQVIAPDPLAKFSQSKRPLRNENAATHRLIFDGSSPGRDCRAASRGSQLVPRPSTYRTRASKSVGPVDGRRVRTMPAYDTSADCRGLFDGTTSANGAATAAERGLQDQPARCRSRM